jgi:hypothetical protein
MFIVHYEGYDIKPHKEVPTNYIVVTSGKGGKIPDILSGLFTTRAYAKAAIDAYLASKPKKVVDEAKPES